MGVERKIGWEPRIVAFTCDWGPCSAGELAGVKGIEYPTNVSIISLPCSCRLTPAILLGAFRTGVDGVLFTGCQMGDCHYVSGNEEAKKVYETTCRLMKALGLHPKRLKQEWVSAEEGERFARLMAEFTEEIRSLGHNPIRVAGVRT